MRLIDADAEQAKSEHDKQTNKQSDFVDSISRQAALAYPLSWEHYDKEHGDRKFICGVESYREYIEHLPSTDRRGNWLDDRGKPAECLHDVYCSECGEMSEYRGLYCPECGAFMMNEDRRRKDERN